MSELLNDEESSAERIHRQEMDNSARQREGQEGIAPPRTGYEAFRLHKLAQSGGKTIKGSRGGKMRYDRSVSGTRDPGKAEVYMRQEYARMKDSDRMRWESEANDRDIRSGREDEAKAVYDKARLAPLYNAGPGAGGNSAAVPASTPSAPGVPSSVASTPSAVPTFTAPATAGATPQRPAATPQMADLMRQAATTGKSERMPYKPQAGGAAQPGQKMPSTQDLTQQASMTGKSQRVPYTPPTSPKAVDMADGTRSITGKYGSGTSGPGKSRMPGLAAAGAGGPATATSESGGTGRNWSALVSDPATNPVVAKFGKRLGSFAAPARPDLLTDANKYPGRLADAQKKHSSLVAEGDAALKRHQARMNKGSQPIASR